jgi:hypothetical protein
MKGIAQIAVGTITVLALTLALGIATSRSVRATVTALVTVANTAGNPVPVKNVVTPGEFPYQQRIFVNQDTSNCTNFVCTARFDAVPAGYRLVITHAAAQFKLGNGNSGGTEPSVSVAIDGSIFGTTLLLPIPIHEGFNKYIASSPVTFYVEAGHQPSLFLSGQFVASDNVNTAEATIVGYLIPTT